MTSITQASGAAVYNAGAQFEYACKDEGAQADPNLLTGLRFHDLRHEAVTRLFERGPNPRR
jgi:hypothetical protein